MCIEQTWFKVDPKVMLFKKHPNTDFLRSLFFRIRIDYGDLQSELLPSIQTQKT